MQFSLSTHSLISVIKSFLAAHFYEIRERLVEKTTRKLISRIKTNAMENNHICMAVVNVDSGF